MEWRRTQFHRRLVLKTIALAAIVLALAKPHLSVFETKMAVAVLVDTSASVSPTDLDRASQVATEIEKARGRHWVRVIPLRPLHPSRRARRVHQQLEVETCLRRSRPRHRLSKPPSRKATALVTRGHGWAPSSSSPMAKKRAAPSPAPHRTPQQLGIPVAPLRLKGPP